VKKQFPVIVIAGAAVAAAPVMGDAIPHIDTHEPAPVLGARVEVVVSVLPSKASEYRSFLANLKR
jgi:hypothetical protein